MICWSVDAFEASQSATTPMQEYYETLRAVSNDTTLENLNSHKNKEISMSSVLAAGLVPNDPSKAAHNSNKLANLRASHNTIRWDSDVSSGTAVYHLQDSVSMKPRESWIGDGMKAVRALFQGNGVILEDNCRS